MGFLHWGVMACFLGLAQNFDWVSFNMVKRTVVNGQVSTVNAKVYYRSSGEMITKFSTPTEMYVLNNTLGDVRIYNPQMNSVVKTLDNRMSSQNTTFFYFLVGKTGDLGLESAGFLLDDSRIEEMMLISEWTPPGELKKEMDKVELVSNGEHPIFMGYLKEDKTYLKKTFYYDFEILGGVDFPMSITEINYVKSDSIITKTSFSNFKFDATEDRDMLDFRIPETATLIE